MSTQDQIDRIKQNVANTYAVLSALGADMPEEQTSDNLATTAGSAKAVLYSAQTLTEAQKAQARENIGVTADGDTVIPPLKIYAKKGTASYKQEIIEGGATKTYTAAELHELVSKRIVVIETYADRNTSAGRGLHQYFETSFASDGTVNQVAFRGVYVNNLYKLVPSYVSVDEFGSIFVSDAEWSGGSVETDQFLTKLGVPADAKKVGDRLTALSEQIANSGGTSGGTSINVTAEVGQTIVVKEVDANGKPTAWEAAEYQSRTHWTEVAEIMPETTVDIDPKSGGMALVDFALEPNKAYTIKYNGVEYAGCVGMEFEGLAFGNLSVLDESLPVTEHPFVLISAAEDMDEDGNIDYVIAILPLDGAESVTLSIGGLVYHTIPREYLPESKPCTIDVVFGGRANVYLQLDLATSSKLVNAILNGDPIYINSTVTNSGINRFERLNGVPSILLTDALTQENNWNSIEDYINTFLMMGVSTNEIPITLTAWSRYMETGLTININQSTGD